MPPQKSRKGCFVLMHDKLLQELLVRGVSERSRAQGAAQTAKHGATIRSLHLTFPTPSTSI
jgi:hypothetical protein